MDQTYTEQRLSDSYKGLFFFFYKASKTCGKHKCHAVYITNIIVHTVIRIEEQVLGTYHDYKKDTTNGILGDIVDGHCVAPGDSTEPNEQEWQREVTYQST